MAALKKANQDKSVAMSFFMRTPFGFIKAQGAEISSYRLLHSQGGMGSGLFIRGRCHSRLLEVKMGSPLTGGQMGTRDCDASLWAKTH